MIAATQSQLSPRLATLLQGWVQVSGAVGALPVTGMTLDSRNIEAGDLFLAFPGEHADGRDFVAQAESRGARAVLAEPGREYSVSIPVIDVPQLRWRVGPLASRFYGDPSLKLAVAGVTGTNGKTTCVRLISQLLRHLGMHSGSIGTLGAETDGSVQGGGLTTPDAVSLQRQLSAWRERGVRAVAMEASSHALDQGRVAGTHFRVALFTNLSRDHLDYHADMAAYLDAKARLFTDFYPEWIVLNADDPASRELAARCRPATERFYYSANGGNADVRCLRAHFEDTGTRLEVASPWGEWRLRSPLLGAFNVANLLAALTAVAGLVPKPDPEALAEAVAALQPVPGRLQVMGNGPRVVIDYAHTPDALSQALVALRSHCRGRLLCVFGAGGDRDPGKRPLMGATAAAAADALWLTSDNPRHEDPNAIIEAIASGISSGKSYHREPDRACAIEQAISAANDEDWILIAGKGHEDYQEVSGVRQPFNDVAVAREVLARRAGA